MNPDLRIVSLVPSITELLYDLGLEEQVVGITKFCVHPDHWFRSKTRIGGTKNIAVDKIRSLSPSIVIASKEENIKEQVDAITSFAEVLLTDIKNLDDALTMIQLIGEKTNTSEKAGSIIQKIKTNFANLLIPILDRAGKENLITPNPKLRVC
jgi:ABC-type hemin transport system substrate-binding protein